MVDSGQQSSPFEQFKNWQEGRHEYAKSWKERTGGKVVGYFCTYAPEELMYAAGILPVRILGSHEVQDVTEPHIFAMFCPFCRDCLAQGLKGRYDYLDGIMISQSCLHIRQAFTSWQKHIPQEYSYYLPMPHHVQSPRALPYLTAELEAFKSSLEEWIGSEITNESIDKAVEVYNTNRRLMRQAYDLRRAQSPPMSGEEAMQMAMSNQLVSKEEHSEELGRLLKILPEREAVAEPGVRLMILGSEDDDIEFISMVESCGSTIVVDDHCVGTRYFWNEVEPNGNRLEAIAKRYIERPPCPTKDWPDYGVQGAIIIQQKFCDPHELDIPIIQKTLKENGIETLFLEFDVTVPIGQFKVRCEAFLEMLVEDDLF
jgi:benzoyl-CoA reductase subunit C